MKIFALLSAAVFGQTTDPPSTAPPATTTLGTTVTAPEAFACLTCNANNVADCIANGTMVECQDSQTSCAVTMRKRRGKTYFVQAGCKALDACLVNKSQNNRGPWKLQECKPYNNKKIENSVCRQCCDGDPDCVQNTFFNADGTDGIQKRATWMGDYVSQDD